MTPRSLTEGSEIDLAGGDLFVGDEFDLHARRRRQLRQRIEYAAMEADEGKSREIGMLLLRFSSSCRRR